MILKTIAFLTCFAGLAFASDYQCRETNGCTALISENGQLKTVNFRKGDIVCTEDGWIVSTEDGWKKLKRKKTTPPTIYECQDPMGGCYGANLSTGVVEHFFFKDIIYGDEYKPIGLGWSSFAFPNELALQGF